MKTLFLILCFAFSSLATANQIDEDVQIALINAARHNNLAKVKDLVENHRADVNHKFRYNSAPPLSHASITCNDKVVDYLISKGAKLDYRQLEEQELPATEYYNDHLWTPLHYAAHTSYYLPQKCIKTIKVLLRRGAKPAQLNNNHETPAFRTFFQSYKFKFNSDSFSDEAFRLLIEEDPFIQDTINQIAVPSFIKYFFEPYTMLSMSLKLGHKNATDLLLRNGARPVSKMPGKTYDWNIQYLCYLTNFENYSTAETLVNLNANVNENCRKESEKVILKATKQKNLDLVELLAGNGAELTELKANSKSNLLFRAINLEANEISKFLIQNHPKLINPDKKLKVWDHQPLVVAIEKGPIDIFDELWKLTQKKEDHLGHYMSSLSKRTGKALRHMLKTIIQSSSKKLRLDLEPIAKSGAFDQATLDALDFGLVHAKVEVNPSLQDAVLQSQDRIEVVQRLLAHSSLKKNTIFTATAYKTAVDKEFHNVLHLFESAGINCKYRSHLLGRQIEIIDLCL
jgi:ankyrin repeat protein